MVGAEAADMLQAWPAAEPPVLLVAAERLQMLWAAAPLDGQGGAEVAGVLAALAVLLPAVALSLR